MDEFLKVLEQFMSALASEIDTLDDETQAELSAFLNEVMQFVGGQGQNAGQPSAPAPAMEAPAPVGADLLWILSGGQADAFINYLRTFPDASLNALLKNPQQLRQVIENLTRSMPQGQGRSESADGIPHAPLDSSNIYGFKYDPRSGRLMVRFQSGSVYGYNGVPPGVFKVFQQGAVPAKTNGQNQYGRWWQGKIPSLGAAFYNLIRQGGYEYQRLQ